MDGEPALAKWISGWQMKVTGKKIISILWCSLGGDNPYVGLVKFHY